jgi:hypothetical protein
MPTLWPRAERSFTNHLPCWAKPRALPVHCRRDRSCAASINAVARLIRSLGTVAQLREKLSQLRRNGAPARLEYMGRLVSLE